MVVAKKPTEHLAVLIVKGALSFFVAALKSAFIETLVVLELALALYFVVIPVTFKFLLARFVSTLAVLHAILKGALITRELVEKDTLALGFTVVQRPFVDVSVGELHLALSFLFEIQMVGVKVRLWHHEGHPLRLNLNL